MDFPLPKPFRQYLLVAPPPWLVESFGDNFHHHHIVTLQVAFGISPGAKGGRTLVGSQPLKLLHELGTSHSELVIKGLTRLRLRQQQLNEHHQLTLASVV